MEKWDAERALQLIDRVRRHRRRHGAHAAAPAHGAAGGRARAVRRLVAAPGDPRGRAVPGRAQARLFAWLGPVIYEFYGASEGGGTLARPEEWLAHPGTVGPTVGRRRREGARRRRQRGAPGHHRHRVPEAHGRVRVQGRSREDRGQPPRRLLHRRRHGRARRRGLPLPARSQDRHGRVGRREHLSRRGGGRAAVASRGRRRRGVRRPARRLGRGGHGGGGAGGRGRAVGRGSPTTCSRTARPCSPVTSCRAGIEFTDAMPRDPNGKLYKRKLRDPYWVGRERAAI